MRRPRAARQDCPAEMWSSPVFFCRNGPCGQQKSPGEVFSWNRRVRTRIQNSINRSTFSSSRRTCGCTVRLYREIPHPANRLRYSRLRRMPQASCRPEGIPSSGSHPAQPCQQHHGAHRTASLNLFSLPLFHPASSVFCAVPRCFFSIISHPRCNLPESRGECTSVPLAPALKTV